MCFMIWGKHRNCSPKPEYQLIKKSDGVIKIGRVKSSRSARRKTSKPALVPSSDVEAQPAQLILPHSQTPSNPQAQSYTQSRSNIGAQRQPLQQRRRSTALDIQAVPGQDQEQVIRRQQHLRRASAPHASSGWTLDQEKALVELMRDELNTPDAADALDRTVEDVTQRWAAIKKENKEAERIGHERQRARQELQNRGQLNDPPFTNQAPPAVAPAVARAVAPAAAPAAPKQRIFLRPSCTPANHNALPVDTAPEPVPTIARLRGQRLAYVEDIGGYEEPERRGRQLHRDREQFQGLRQPMIPTVTGQAPSAAPAAAHAAQQQKGGSLRSPSQKPANCDPVGGYAANQAPWAVPAAPEQRRFPQSSHNPANRNAVPVHPAPESVPAAPRPAPTIARLRGQLAYVEDIEDQDEEAERRSRELQRDKERLQKLRQPIPRVTKQAPSAAPAADHAAQQQKGSFVRSPSRKPANCNPVTGYAANQAPWAAPAAAPAAALRQRSPSTPYRLLDSERQGYASGSASARPRPTHRYRSPTPQGRKDREQSTVEQTNKPAVVQAPNQETFGVPGYAPEPFRRVWTKGHYGWESRVIGRID